MESYRAVIDLFDTKTKMADLVQVRAQTVEAWHNRDSIPPGRWNAVVAACAEIGQEITVNTLADIAEARLK